MLVTQPDTSNQPLGLQKFPDWTSKVNLLSRVVRFRLPAGGCRFGSGPGRSWGSLPVACCLFSRSSFFSVGSKSLGKARNWPVMRPKKKGTDLKTGSEP